MLEFFFNTVGALVLVGAAIHVYDRIFPKKD